MPLGIKETVTFEAERVIRPIYTGGDVSVDHKSQFLATSLGEQAILTDLKDGRLLLSIEGDGEAITSLAISPDASFIVICSRSSSMGIYELEQSENHIEAVLKRTVKPFSTPVVSLSIDTTNTLLATGGTDGSVKIWDIHGGFVTHTFRGHAGIVSALKLFYHPIQVTENRSKNGDSGKNKIRLASGGEDGKVRIWDLTKKKSYAILEAHVAVVRSIDFSDVQNALITGSRDKTVAIWDGKTWKPRKVVPLFETIESVGFIGQGHAFFSGGDKGSLRLWDTETGKEITEGQDAHSRTSGIVSVQYSSSSSSLLCVRADQMLEMYSVESIGSSYKKRSPLPLPLLQRISGTHDEIIDFAYVSAGHQLMALATNTEYLKLVAIAEDRAGRDGQYFGADVALLEGHEDIIICLDVDWSGQWIVTGAKDNSARLWYVDHSIEVYSCVGTYTGHAGSLGAIALSQTSPMPDTAAFSDPSSHPPQFIITGSQDQTIKRWNIPSGKVNSKSDKSQSRAIYTRKAHDKDINALAVNADSTLFASASQDRLVKIWSTEEGQVQGILRGHKRGVWSVRFGPKGIPAIYGDAGAASSKRGVILTGSGDKSVKIWSLSDYSCVRTFEGHTNSVLKVVWFPPQPASPAMHDSDTKRPYLVASAGGDGLVKVWDMQTSECVSTLDNHTERVWALTASPDLNKLVSGGGDGVVTFWVDTTITTMEQAAAESTRRIEQEQELANHIYLGHYRAAITLALQLNHPGRLLALFSDVIRKRPADEGSLSGVRDVDEVIATLSDEQLYTLLLRIRDWNANGRTAQVAQHILWVIVKSFPAAKLVKLQKRGRGLGEVLDGLKAYTERHYKRTEELLEESYLIDYVVAQMGEEGFVEEEPWRLNGHVNGNDKMLGIE